MMHGFDVLLERWRAADAQACEQERLVSEALDRYCAGQGPAPSVEEIASTRRLRVAASAALAHLLDHLRRERDQLRWL
jgi:hypothetical protein